MAKTRYFSIGRRAVDTTELGKFITDAAQTIFEAQLDDEVNDIVEELETLLENIGERSALRGRGFYAVRYNKPINKEDAPIIIRKRRDRNGDLSYTIRVDNDKFNILDQGSPERKSAKLMRFPRYTGSMTTPNSLNLRPEPVRILDQRTNDVNDLDRFFTGEGWVATYKVGKIVPRNFFRLIANKVRKRRRGFTKISIRKS